MLGVNTVQFMTAVKNQRNRNFEGALCRRWLDEWFGEIKKTREMDQDARRQVNDDKIYTSEKHFNPEDIEICECSFKNSPTITCTLDRNVFTRP